MAPSFVELQQQFVPILARSKTREGLRLDWLHRAEDDRELTVGTDPTDPRCFPCVLSSAVDRHTALWRVKGLIRQDSAHRLGIVRSRCDYTLSPEVDSEVCRLHWVAGRALRSILPLELADKFAIFRLIDPHKVI